MDPKALAEKWLNGTITEEEKAYFEKWYNDFDFSSLSIPYDARGHVFKRLQRQIRPEKVIPLSIKMAAAALLTGILAGTIYLLLSQHHQPLPVIVPGGNKAVLTLADGTHITLDSAANGAIARQGATQIVKLSNGELAYRESEHRAGAMQYNTINTPRGGQYHIQLPDGTNVWLNAASALKYPAAFTGSERRVELTGEAYFEVAANAAQPFFLQVNNMTVQVLGTNFNVNAYADEQTISTTLLSGSVKIVSGRYDHTLLPGQKALVNKEQSTINTITTDTEDEIAWKNGIFLYNNTDIASVMRQISRWYDVNISYQGTMTDNSFTGSISRNADISQVLKLLELTGGVHFKVTGKNITVMP